MDELDDAILRAIPAEARTLYARLLQEPDPGIAALRDGAQAHLANIAEAARRLEFIPLEMAKQLAEASDKLLGVWSALSPAQRLHARAAIRYFIVDDDADSDTSSITGLDDDAEVMNAVLRALGRPEWEVELL